MIDRASMIRGWRAFGQVACGVALVTWLVNPAAAVAATAAHEAAPARVGALHAPPETVTLTHVHGIAHNGTGGVMGHWIVFADLHLTLTHAPVGTLDHAMTGPSGGFVLNVTHTAGLASYAAKHAGRLNVDLLMVSRDGKHMFSARTTFPYGAGTVSTGVHRLELTSHWVGHTDRQGNLKPDYYPPTLGQSQVSNPQIQWFEAQGNMSVTHRLSTSWTGSIEAGAGATFEDWGISGSVTASKTSEMAAQGTLRGPQPRAYFFTNGVKTVDNLKCADTLIWTGLHDNVKPGPIMCTYTTVASWLSPPSIYRPHRGKFVQCWSAPGHVAFSYNPAGNNQLTKTRASDLQSRVFMGAAGGWVIVRVGYSHGSVQTYTYGLNPDGNKHYCIAGSDNKWFLASRVYVGTRP